MRQKYVISRNVAKNRLKIREYADIGKNPKRSAVPIVKKGRYTFLCEEIYDADMIARSISRGLNSLVASLRTPNLFPIDPTATQIAESIVKLYDSAEDSSVELFFDDMDLVPDHFSA